MFQLKYKKTISSSTFQMNKEQLYFGKEEDNYQQEQEKSRELIQESSDPNQSQQEKLKIQNDEKNVFARQNQSISMKSRISGSADKRKGQNSSNQIPSNNNQSGLKRKNRRKKVDDDGRDYTCSCGKSYLSYPALYTHVKTKHNRQLAMLTDPQAKKHAKNNQIAKLQQYNEQNNLIQNTLSALGSCHNVHNFPSSGKQTSCYQNQHSQLAKVSSNSMARPQIHSQQLEQQIANIQKLKQFIYKQFVKDKSKESLNQIKNCLRLNDDEIRYVKNIIQQAEEGADKDSFISKINLSLEGSGKNSKINQKDTALRGQQQGDSRYNNHDKIQMLRAKQNQDSNNLRSINGTPEFNSPIKRGTLLTNNNASIAYPLSRSNSTSNLHNNNSSSNKCQKKGFSSYVRLAHQNSLLKKQNREENSFYVQQILGIFLSQVFRTSSNAYFQHELVNLMCINFVCCIKQFFTRKSINLSQKQVQYLIEGANEVIEYFVEINKNKYLRQPVAICKIMFYFYRWLYAAKFTNKFIKFNQVGGTERYKN